MASGLAQMFQNQFGNNQQALDFLRGKMVNAFNHPQGYSPAALAAMRTSATDTLSNEFNHEQQALNAREFAQGGRDLPSGVNAQINAGLGAEEAAQKAGAQNQITQANEDLRQQNYWRSLGALDSITQQEYQPYTDLQAAESFAGQVPQAVNAATNANNSGFGAKLEGSIAQGLGADITGNNGSSAAGLGGFY